MEEIIKGDKVMELIYEILSLDAEGANIISGMNLEAPPPDPDIRSLWAIRDDRKLGLNTFREIRYYPDDDRLELDLSISGEISCPVRKGDFFRDTDKALSDTFTKCLMAYGESGDPDDWERIRAYRDRLLAHMEGRMEGIAPEEGDCERLLKEYDGRLHSNLSEIRKLKEENEKLMNVVNEIMIGRSLKKHSNKDKQYG